MEILTNNLDTMYYNKYGALIKKVDNFDWSLAITHLHRTACFAIFIVELGTWDSLLLDRLISLIFLRFILFLFCFQFFFIKILFQRKRVNYITRGN